LTAGCTGTGGTFPIKVVLDGWQCSDGAAATAIDGTGLLAKSSSKNSQIECGLESFDDDAGVKLIKIIGMS